MIRSVDSSGLWRFFAGVLEVRLVRLEGMVAIGVDCGFSVFGS